MRGSVRQVTQYPLREANHPSRAFIHSADVTRGMAILAASARLADAVDASAGDAANDDDDKMSYYC